MEAAVPEPIVAPTKMRKKMPLRWEQQPGDNDLWFARFLRYVALGPGRSVSLLVKGRRNAYPVPAHWPIQAKQLDWRARAEAFDAAAKANPALIPVFNDLLRLTATTAPKGEPKELEKVIAAGGYKIPPVEEDYEDKAAASPA